MPWSPIGKFPNVIERLRSWGYTKEASIKDLNRALMLETGIINHKTLARYIRAMEELKFIEIRSDRVVEIKNNPLM